MKLKLIRQRLKMTRTELAEALGITYGAIANYEQRIRKPHIDICYRLIDLCKKHKIKISMEDIYSR